MNNYVAIVMGDNFDIGELHGTVPSTISDDKGFSEDKRCIDLDDEVFLEEGTKPVVLPSITQSSSDTEFFPSSKLVARNRRETKSSGFVSDVTISPFDVEQGKSRCRTTIKEKIDFCSQTDFSSDDECLELNLASNAVAQISPDTDRRFCWRHDDVYNEFLSPSARPPSASSFQETSPSTRLNQVCPKTLNLSKRSCQQCKVEEAARIDLRSRKESIRLNKEQVQLSVAEVKNCPINLLSASIHRCSHLWTENRTFYLGTTLEQDFHGKRQRTLSAPTPTKQQPICFHCIGQSISSEYELYHQSCSRHSLWIHSLSISRDHRQGRRGANKESKRDWILVQCVTKYSQKFPNSDVKPTYREYGKQEMILCPAELRSVDYIEDLCCQHFMKMTRDQAVKANRKVELLFSPKGPMVREDKHLTGRSIFYFCCDGPLDYQRQRSKSQAAEDNNDDFFISYYPTVTKSKSRGKSSSSLIGNRRRRSVRSRYRSAKSPKHRIASADSDAAYRDDASSALAKAAAASLPTDSSVHAFTKDSNSTLKNAWHENAFCIKSAALTDPPSTLNAVALCRNGKNNSMCKADKTRKPIEKKQAKPASERKSRTKSVEKDDSNDMMRKSVTFADEANDEDTPSNENKFDQKRRASLPPPPPQYLGETEGFVEHRRKRRESVAISFGGMPVKPKNDQQEEPVKSNSFAVRAYEKPTWNSVKISVTFKGERYSSEFPEQKTLEDVYSWLRQQLLKNDAFTPGSDLLLSHDNLKFPLKANTASRAVATLPTELTCGEIKQAGHCGGFGDTNSRFDTRFSLPIDMRSLEGVTPVQYLSKHCIVSNTWRAFYRNTFQQNDRDRDGKITYKELKNAMDRLFVELSRPLMRRVLFLMGYDPSSKSALISTCQFDLNQGMNGVSRKDGDPSRIEPWQERLSIDKDTFVSICALANRIICRETKIDDYPVDTIKQSGTQLEDADFYNIEGKLRECKLEPLTRRLLLYVNK